MKKFIIPDTEDEKEKQEKLNNIGRLAERLEKKSFIEELSLLNIQGKYDLENNEIQEFIRVHISPNVFSILGEKYNNDWNSPGQSNENSFVKNGILIASFINRKTKKYFSYIIKRREKGSFDFDLYLATCEEIGNKYKVRYFSSLSELFADKSSKYSSKLLYFTSMSNASDNFGFPTDAKELHWIYEIYEDFSKHF